MSAIESESNDSSIALSAISVWELWMLVKKGRLELTVDASAFLSTTSKDPQFRIVPIDDSICRRSVELPDHHVDPADRFILATAVELGCAIVSKDKKLSLYSSAQIIW